MVMRLWQERWVGDVRGFRRGRGRRRHPRRAGGSDGGGRARGGRRRLREGDRGRRVGRRRIMSAACHGRSEHAGDEGGARHRQRVYHAVRSGADGAFALLTAERPFGQATPSLPGGSSCERCERFPLRRRGVRLRRRGCVPAEDPGWRAAQRDAADRLPRVSAGTDPSDIPGSDASRLSAAGATAPTGAPTTPMPAAPPDGRPGAIASSARTTSPAGRTIATCSTESAPSPASRPPTVSSRTPAWPDSACRCRPRATDAGDATAPSQYDVVTKSVFGLTGHWTRAPSDRRTRRPPGSLGWCSR